MKRSMIHGYQVAITVYGVQKRTNVDTWTIDILRAFIRLPPVSVVTLSKSIRFFNRTF